MSYAYDEYLRAHKKNVRDAFEWILKYIPEVFINDKNGVANVYIYRS